ncbi:interleukin-8 [Syngnathoides biaculeatus]|uniref:interleukin-8 n=1 Tax=Syngnathoides biaculeatus TaxID=300417 RepID=UPI002ADE7995|nr:interleukin-8 [Syngnathoides biaculeatus]
MMSKAILGALVVLLASAAVSEAMALRSLGVELHCRCIQTESRPIIRHRIERLELILPNSHCEDTEIIATLKKSGHQVCLDPKADWVERAINKMLEKSKRR